MDPPVRGLNGIVLVVGLGLFICSLGYLLWRTRALRNASDDRQADEDAASGTSADGGNNDNGTGGFVFGDERYSDGGDDTTGDSDESG